MKYLLKWKAAVNTSLLSAKFIKKSVNKAAIIDVLDQQRKSSVTMFAVVPRDHFQSAWFKPKPWVTDSCHTKVLAMFRSCNASLGNRGPTKDGRFFKLCPLCEEQGVAALNNEV